MIKKLNDMSIRKYDNIETRQIALFEFFSDQNHSDMRRWVMITSVNKKLNNPTRPHHHPQYHPLRMLPNSAILDCNVMNSSEEKWYVVPQRLENIISY